MKAGMKQTILKLAKCMMIPAGAIYTMVRPAGSVAILMYHRVNDGVCKELSVKSADFRWQMEYLKRKGYRVISLDEAMRARKKPHERKGKCVVLTFDDGYEDFFHNAYPVLWEYGYTAIVYLVPGYVETGRVFRWDGDIGESRLMTWEQIETLKESRIIQFGSHTMTHADMDGLSEVETYRELMQSRDALQQRLRVQVRHFAYPRGIVTPGALAAAKKLYESAVSIFDGSDAEPGSKRFDPVKLKRLPVQRSDGRHLFRARLNGWLAPEGWLKLAIGRH